MDEHFFPDDLSLKLPKLVENVIKKLECEQVFNCFEKHSHEEMINAFKEHIPDELQNEFIAELNSFYQSLKQSINND